MAHDRTTVPVKVQKRSGFDKSHFNALSGELGVITPILIDELPGNSRVHCRINLAASLPPLATDAFIKTEICVEAFAIPLRLCYGGFEQWYCQKLDKLYDYSDVNAYDGAKVITKRALMPTIYVPEVDMSDNFEKGQFTPLSLSDYLGLGNGEDTDFASNAFRINPLPFIAYHLCYDHYYRNQLVSSSCFARMGRNSDVGFYNDVSTNFIPVGALPYITLYDDGGTTDNVISWKLPNGVTGREGAYNIELADGWSLFRCRRRNFGYDYFTNAYPLPQLGDEMSVESAESFTIASLRAANSMQVFKEMSQIPGGRYQDTLKVRTGASISDGVAQRPILLGSARYNCYTKEVVTSGANSNTNYTTYNPFSGYLGASGGVVSANGSDLIIDGFEVKEPSYILINATLVPTATYGSGTNRILTRYRDKDGSITDMACHLLQNVGNQPIYQYELNGRIGQTNDAAAIFGYTDRFADWMQMRDEVHGLMRPSNSLQYYIAQRNFFFTDEPTIMDSFLKIPSDYLDEVAAVRESISSLGFWMQVAFDYKVSMPLAEYSVPSLQDPAYEHGDTVRIHRGGFHF